MVTNIKILDKYDKTLLNTLMRDSQTSLKNLKDTIIEKAYPLIDATRLGFIPFDLYLKTNMNKSEELKFIELLKKEKKIFYMERLVGIFSIRISFFEKNIPSSSNFIKEILKDFIKKIDDVKVNIISSLIKTNNGILNSSLGKISKLFEVNENILLDKKTLKILQIINKNPRLSFVEISEKTKFSREFIKKTIRKMEKRRIIIGYTIDIDIEKMGFTSKLLILKIKICDKENYDELFED